MCSCAGCWCTSLGWAARVLPWPMASPIWSMSPSWLPTSGSLPLAGALGQGSPRRRFVTSLASLGLPFHLLSWFGQFKLKTIIFFFSHHHLNLIEYMDTAWSGGRLRCSYFSPDSSRILSSRHRYCPSGELLLHFPRTTSHSVCNFPERSCSNACSLNTGSLVFMIPFGLGAAIRSD